MESAGRQHLGHGIGLRPAHYAYLLEHGAVGVEWLEVISENHFGDGGRHWAVLERVRRDVPVVLHGVSMNLGGADPLSESYLQRLERAIERVQPAWVSDHLCWGAVDGRYAHDLLPIPYTPRTLDHVAARVSVVQERLGRRILVENITRYLEFTSDELSELEFLNALCRRTGCGLLLDVNNLYVNAENLGTSAEDVLDGLDPGIVGQIHLAGHTRYTDGSVIDTHVGPTPDPVWALYRRAIARLGGVPTLVEWDEAVPALDVVLAEAARARAVEQEVLRG